MWETTAKWLIENHGLLGIMVVGLGGVIAVESAVIVYLFKRYAAQVEKCIKCKDDSEVRHDEVFGGFYDTMRDENHQLWDRMEKSLDKVSTALGSLMNKMSEFSGKLNGVGRH